MKDGRDVHGIGQLLMDNGWTFDGKGFCGASMVHAEYPGVITYSLSTGEWVHGDEDSGSNIKSTSKGAFARIQLLEWLETMKRHGLKAQLCGRTDKL